MKKLFFTKMLPAVLVAFAIETGNVYAQKYEFANFKRYEKANDELPQPSKKEKRVVFMGNSITEGWARTHPDFFKENGYIGRGIGGQTSYQFLLRFREDVINLSPDLVVINAGTNDIAENTGPYVEDYTFGNIVSMVELAKANDIKVILTSVLPAAEFKWNKKVKDAPEKIKSLNSRIKAYAKKHKIPYADYYAKMLAPDGKSLEVEYGRAPYDGVHPSAKGYDVMESAIKPVIEKSLKR